MRVFSLRTRIVLCCVVCGVAALGMAQQVITPAEALTRVVEHSPAQAAWFAPSFLAQVSTAQVDTIVKQYAGTLGALKRLDATGDGFTLVMELGTAPAKIHLDGEGRIDGLWFGPPQLAKPASLEDTMKAMAALPGKVSAVVLDEGKPMAALRPDDALAVGSAFKLAILAAAGEQTAAGELPLDKAYELKKEWKSLPSGVLQTWPEGSPLTVATLENEMISISDNTAADAMLSIVGRDAAEKAAERNKPFLSTREAFVLKAKANAGLLESYRKADVNGRRAMLAQIDALPLPDTAQFGDAVLATDVEWFFTANELCSLVARSAGSAAFKINPGLASTADWKRVAFKGGSEGGVLNITTDLQGKNGKHYCVAATWNNSALLDQGKFFALYGSLLGTLAKTSAQ